MSEFSFYIVLLENVFGLIPEYQNSHMNARKSDGCENLYDSCSVIVDFIVYGLYLVLRDICCVCVYVYTHTFVVFGNGFM